MSDSVESVGPTETTSQLNQRLKTKTFGPLPEGCKNAAEAFNVLSPEPLGPVPLGGGRVLMIQEWHPVGDDKTHCGIVSITIKGFIKMDNSSNGQT